MKLFLILLICSLFSKSCTSKSFPGEKTEKEPVNSISPSCNTTTDEPFLYLFSGNKYDFGIASGIKRPFIPVEIEIKNTGKNPLVILKADVSCGCLSVNYPKEPIHSGKKGIINITINTKGQSGYFNKTIFLKSNAVNDIELIRIIGQIK